MKKKLLFVYQYLSKAFIQFAVTVIIIICMNKVFGNEAKDYSTLFRYGSDAIANSSLIELLFTSLFITLIHIIIFSAKVFKNLLLIWKTAVLLICTIIIILCSAFLFGWFPTDSVEAWLGFFLSFFICFTVSTILMIIKTKLEENKYDKLLAEYKKKKAEEIENESY